MGGADASPERLDEDAATPPSAELEHYIQELKRCIEMLQAENRELRAEVREYQRRELHAVLQRP